MSLSTNLDSNHEVETPNDVFTLLPNQDKKIDGSNEALADIKGELISVDGKITVLEEKNKELANQVKFIQLSDYLPEESIDITVLTESWLNANINSNTININSYSSIIADGTGRGGGVAFFVIRNIPFKRIASQINANLEQLRITSTIRRKVFVFGVLYRPPDGSIPLCLSELDESVFNLLPTCDFYLAAGDLHIDLLKNDRHFSTFFYPPTM
ncbi:hypothetical protein JTB14_034034 [Gonioctena quinquepunctata]|nr:hypothetical protein JTB14_034034 [Gonioctena quinquepunctata]